MTDPRFEQGMPTRLTEVKVTVHRQPVLRPDRSLYGYAVGAIGHSSLARRGADLEPGMHAAYTGLDLGAIAGESLVFVRATVPMLIGDWPLPDAPGGLVLEVPDYFADHPDVVHHLTGLRELGLGLALEDYVPGTSQDALLSLVDFVKVDLVRGIYVAEYAIECAHHAQIAVIAERVDSEADIEFCAARHVELLQGPLFQRDTATVEREFSAGEVQCLELVSLLSADEVDLDRVTKVIGSDPELTMSVLRLVNSSALGGRTRIDSARRAVVMLGPRPLRSIAMQSLMGARDNTSTGLWYMLTRAIACRFIAEDDAAYTVGLLSSVASQLQVEPADLLARTGVSDDVGAALLTRSGPYGPVLAAVLAHEANDDAAVEATGLDPDFVAQAYLDAVVQALATVTELAGSHNFER